jgi:hypothetical protein
MYQRRGDHHGHPLATSRALMRLLRVPDMSIAVTLANYTYVALLGCIDRMDSSLMGRNVASPFEPFFFPGIFLNVFCYESLSPKQCLIYFHVFVIVTTPATDL